MLILTILLSLALAALFTLLPARIHHRRPVRADLYAGAGASALPYAVLLYIIPLCYLVTRRRLGPRAEKEKI